jgi:large subunit ribosomal protein L24
MAKSHVKKGDEVVVLAGTERGRRGKVIAILKGGTRVIVEGIKLIKKHVRKNQQYPQGAIVQREGSIHISNVMRADRYDSGSRRAAAQPAETAS